LPSLTTDKSQVHEIASLQRTELQLKTLGLTVDGGEKVGHFGG
jgi:hypothetical protein